MLKNRFRIRSKQTNFCDIRRLVLLFREIVFFFFAFTGCHLNPIFIPDGKVTCEKTESPGRENPVVDRNLGATCWFFYSSGPGGKKKDRSLLSFPLRERASFFFFFLFFFYLFSAENKLAIPPKFAYSSSKGNRDFSGRRKLAL